MRRLFSTLAIAAVLAGSAGPGLAEGLSVPIDHSMPITLPAGAQNVMIGNPALADLSIIDARNAVLLGRGYGVTNLLVLDARGRTLMDRQITVSAVDTGRVNMIRGSATGPHVENYTCSPRCQREPMPGEIDSDFAKYSAGYTGYSARATDGRNSSGAKVGP